VELGLFGNRDNLVDRVRGRIALHVCLHRPALGAQFKVDSQARSGARQLRDNGRLARAENELLRIAAVRNLARRGGAGAVQENIKKSGPKKKKKKKKKLELNNFHTHGPGDEPAQVAACMAQGHTVYV
jgi:hypothetical protein